MAKSSPKSLLLRGGTVLTMDEQASVLPGTDVLLLDGRIEAMGEDLDTPTGGEVLDVRDCWVLPGLIQGHLHLGQTFFRGLAEGRRLLPWLRERIWPLEAAHDDESAYWCSLLGAAECLLADLLRGDRLRFVLGAGCLHERLEQCRHGSRCLLGHLDGVRGQRDSACLGYPWMDRPALLHGSHIDRWGDQPPRHSLGLATGQPYRCRARTPSRVA